MSSSTSSPPICSISNLLPAWVKEPAEAKNVTTDVEGENDHERTARRRAGYADVQGTRFTAQLR